MRWTVEVTHFGTGEELVIVVDAETAEQAAARARDSGFRVRDCSRDGGGAYKVIRVIAWVWFGFCSGLAVLCPVLGFGGWLATPGDPGEGIVGGIFLLVGGAALGLLVARAMTSRTSARVGHRPAPRIRSRGWLPRASLAGVASQQQVMPVGHATACGVRCQTKQR